MCTVEGDLEMGHCILRCVVFDGFLVCFSCSVCFSWDRVVDVYLMVAVGSKMEFGAQIS